MVFFFASSLFLGDSVLIGGMKGSITAYPHSDERMKAFEIGASIFVDADRHMVKAAKVRYTALIVNAADVAAPVLQSHYQ